MGGDGHLYLATSTDHGAKWSTERDLTPPGLTAINLPAANGGDAGMLAVAFMGSGIAHGYDATKDEMKAARWDAYLMIIRNATSDAPSVTVARLNTANDPLVRGPCGPGRCSAVFDFFDVVVDGDGRAWVSLVDACTKECATSSDPTATSTPSTAAIRSTFWTPVAVSIWAMTRDSLFALRIFSATSPDE